jgi:hypothetical protein
MGLGMKSSEVGVDFLALLSPVRQSDGRLLGVATGNVLVQQARQQPHQ